MNFNIKKAFGKTQNRSQMGLLFTEDGRIEEKEIAVGQNCAADEAMKKAWLLDARNQFAEEGTKVYFQLLGERSAIPISVIEDSKVKALEILVNKIFHESWTSDKIQLQNESKQDVALTRLYTMLGIPLILGMLIIGIRVIGSIQR